MQRIGGQVRRDFGDVLGWDYTAVSAMARDMGICIIAVTEFLPFIEVEMVNGRAAQKSGAAFDFPEGEN